MLYLKIPKLKKSQILVRWILRIFVSVYLVPTKFNLIMTGIWNNFFDCTYLLYNAILKITYLNKFQHEKFWWINNYTYSKVFEIYYCVMYCILNLFFKKNFLKYYLNMLIGCFKYILKVFLTSTYESE